MAYEIPAPADTAGGAFERLVGIIDTLRVACPWDMKQTMESLRLLSIEELYELTDAILDKDYQEVKKELGDVMVHLVFYAKIATEEKQFTLVESLNAVCEKLISRHPHIYGDTQAETEEIVKSNWEQLKLKEGNRSVLSGVPKGLPALVKAYRIQDKVRGVGFDWEDKAEVWAKVEEELDEFKQEFNISEAEKIDMDKAEAEFGDLLFSLINYGRHLGINPENALERTNKKFIFRFNHLEKRAAEAGKQLKDMTLAEMDVYWNEAKKL
ncbi:nucleoside triphosphate pyrophosphohydrolase [Sphingobacterium sp. MYb382]|uniref:nucleoside triphosphate pyrophosphohydrolase n=1 Tax=Sphingobacterium sp. MYb382 TaxID=2745278 RepID=UPI0030A5036D